MTMPEKFVIHRNSDGVPVAAEFVREPQEPTAAPMTADRLAEIRTFLTMWNKSPLRSNASSTVTVELLAEVDRLRDTEHPLLKATPGLDDYLPDPMDRLWEYLKGNQPARRRDISLVVRELQELRKQVTDRG